MEFVIKKAGVVAKDRFFMADVRVKDGVITEIGSGLTAEFVLKASDLFLYPALLNAHDHLLGTYYPRVGEGRPYKFWYEWELKLKSSDIYRERSKLPNDILYKLGDYKCIFGGVTTVADHIPYEILLPVKDKLHIRVRYPYRMVHSVHPRYRLPWGSGIREEYEKAVELDIPFYVHIEEGFIPEIQEELPMLEKEGGLGPNTLLIHCIGFSKEDIEKTAKAGASVVWCCYSNFYMYGKTAPIPMFVEKGINVCLGTDSCMSGSDNMFHELKFAFEYWSKHWGEPDPLLFFSMVTVNPARALRLPKLGEVKEGNLADLLLIQPVDDDPYISLINSTALNMVMLAKEGKPLFLKKDIEDFADFAKIKGKEMMLTNGVEVWVIGDLPGLLNEINRILGFKKELPFLPVRFNG